MRNINSSKVPSDFRRRFVCRLLSCVFMASSAAAGDDGNISVEADLMDDDGRHMRAQGAVKASFSDYRLCAGQLEYDRETGLLSAVGEINLTHGNGEMRGERFKYDLNRATGRLENGSGQLAESALRVHGDSISLRQRRLQIDNAVLTSCPPDNETWQLRFKEAESDLDRRQLTVRDALFEIGGLPLLYFPYGKIYYGKERRSGLLPPQVHFGSAGGFRLNAPYYFNLAKNYDWTMTPDWSSKHGFELANEFRFLTRYATGQLNFAAVPFDDERRSHGALNYDWRDERWRFYLDAESVSDHHYLRDFGAGDDKSIRNLPRQAVVEYHGNDWTARVQAADYQTLSDDLVPPHRIVPAVSLWQGGAVTAMQWNNEWQYTRFLHSEPGAVEGGRFLWRGQLRRYYAWHGISISPGAGAHAVKYRTQNAADESFVVPYMRLDAEKTILPQLDSRLRLRAAYIYAPEREQESAPVYDTAVKQNTLENIYQWNRFVGGDRASDANLFVYGVEYFVRDPATGADIGFIGLAQPFWLRDAQVLLPDETAAPEKGFGQVLLEGRWRFSERWRGEGDLEWDARDSNIERFYLQLNGQHSPRHLVRAEYLRDEEEIAALGFAMPLGQRLDVALSADYLFNDNRFTRSQLALQLRNECDCLRIFFKVKNTLVGEDDSDTEFSVGIEFVGLGGIGGAYEDTLGDLR